MPFPGWVGRINKRLTNRVLIRFANRPPFAALTHVGRSSGREYRIPITPFKTEEGFLIALTYGSEADWVKNVLTAGQAMLEYDGEPFALAEPRLETKAQAWADVSFAAKPMLLMLNVDEFLRMRTTELPA